MHVCFNKLIVLSSFKIRKHFQMLIMFMMDNIALVLSLLCYKHTVITKTTKIILKFGELTLHARPRVITCFLGACRSQVHISEMFWFTGTLTPITFPFTGLQIVLSINNENLKSGFVIQQINSI